MSTRTAKPSGPLTRWMKILSTLLLLLTVLWFYLAVWDLQAFLEWKQETGFWVFFLCLAILPMVGMPTTPVFILAGATFEPVPALLGCALSIALNLVLSYWMARHWLRRPLTSLLKRWRYELPKFSGEHAVRFIILVRLVPGLPTFIKNYVTALTDVSFSVYVSISWIITFLYAIGLIVLGDSLFKGDVIEGASAVVILAVVLLAFAWVARRQQQAAAARGSAAPEPIKPVITSKVSSP